MPEEDEAYFDKQASILSKSYKKMCMTNNFNFKQPVRAVVDIGCATRCVFTRQLKFRFQARYSFGIELSKYKVEQCDNVLQALHDLKDGQIDIFNCDSVLHSINDSAMRPILDQLIRTCGKFLIIKDFELGDDYDIMKQFAITRELASGVLAPSDIPDCILADEDGIADPGMYYN